MLNQIKSKPCITDAVIIMIVFAALITPCFFGVNRRTGSKVEIYTPDSKMTYALSSNKTVDLTSEGYLLTVAIEDSAACIVHSDCPDKICERTGKISKNGESIICLPAKVTVTISSGEDSYEDWIVR